MQTSRSDRSEKRKTPPRPNVAVKLVLSVTVILVNLVGDVQHALCKPNKHCCNQQRFRALALDGSNDLLQVVKPVRAISMSGDDGLVLDC